MRPIVAGGCSVCFRRDAVVDVSSRSERPRLPDSGIPPLVDPLGEVLDVDALRRLLTAFNPHQRDGDLAGGDLAQVLLRRQVGEVVAAHIGDRDHRAAAILRHQEEPGVDRHDNLPIVARNLGPCRDGTQVRSIKQRSISV